VSDVSQVSAAADEVSDKVFDTGRLATLNEYRTAALQKPAHTNGAPSKFMPGQLNLRLSPRGFAAYIQAAHEPHATFVL